MSDRLRQALWEREDGELPAGERRWLEDRLAGDPGARHQADLVARLAARLDRLPEKEAPPELRPRIERGLDALDEPVEGRGRRDAVAAGPGGLSWPFGGRWRPRLAWLAAGLVLGAFVYHLILGVHGPWTPRELEDVYGAILPPAESSGPELRLPLREDAGTVVLRGRDSLLLVELERSDEDDRFEHSPDGVDLVVRGGGGIARIALRHDGATPPDVRHEGGTLRVLGLSGERLLVWARVDDPAEPLEVEVSSDEGILARARFGLEGIGGSSR